MFLSLQQHYLCGVQKLHTMHASLSPLLLRWFLAWEFGEAGWAKWHGQNWFAELRFPFPFDLLPPWLNWQLAMSFELLGAVALFLGLFTRFFALQLVVITWVAIASVHWPEHWNHVSDLLMGYRFEDSEGDGFGNFKLPFIYLLVLVPLLLGGAGRWSVDAYLMRRKQLS